MSRRIAPFWSPHGLAFCPLCQEPLSTEEIDFECCDACGGEGFDDDDLGADDLSEEEEVTPPTSGLCT